MRALITADVETLESGVFPSDNELRTALREMGLRARDFPEKSEGEDDAKYEERLRNYFQQRASKIFDRIPEHDEEQKQKKQLEREALLFTGYLVKSDTDFMVTRRSDRTLLLRLLNSRIGKLHEASRDMVLELTQWNKRPRKSASTTTPGHVCFLLHDEIELYEHGLEEPTVIGTIINSRLKYTLSEESRELLVGFVTLLAFLVMLLINPAIGTRHPNLHGAFERLETALITTTLVSLLALTHAYFRLVPVIQWSIEYKPK